LQQKLKLNPNYSPRDDPHKTFKSMESNIAKQIVEQNASKCNYNFNVSYADGTRKQVRLFVGSGSGDVCQFKKGSRTRGYFFYLGNVTDIAPVAINATAPEVMLKRNAKKAADLLSASGLWADRLQQFQLLASLTDDEAAQLLSIAARYFDYSGERNEMEARHQKAYEDYESFFKSHNIESYSIYSIQQLATKGQIISIPYNRWSRNYDRQHIANEIARHHEDPNHSNTHLSWRGSYDYSVSIERNKKDGQLRGWYSAEYKNCGNGHYYFLLDATHALFGEDD